MFSEQFFDIVLNFGDEWRVDDVKVNFKLEEVDIYVSYILDHADCPESFETCSIYDHRNSRRWRHLDTLQFKTYINCKVPRVKSALGVKTISVPWADNYERHTYLFERLTIDLLKATKNQTQTAKLLRCGFNVVNRIIHSSVKRGMERRPKDVAFKHLSLDEKSFRKGHQYISVLSSPLAGCVIDVVAGRDKQDAKALLERVITPENRDFVETVSLDMWKAYLSSVEEILPKADIVHDRFHLIKYLNDAIDKVRRREVKHHEELKNSRFVLLKNKENLTDNQQIIFEHIQAANYQVSKAWRVREDFKDIFASASIEDAFPLFIKWGASVLNTNIKEVIKVAKMFNNHLKGVINALTQRYSNAMAERLNGKIQEIKTVGRGYRTFANFRSAILFFHGGLDLYPQI
ncbi:ISL3 family transposase [Polaribacter litorisediminis]|uniref:ISL3 family transposase n=1 Tax=Polaribacter litorisediminis TaxID=1908341 RepID=UPI001CBFDF91|nr:ISL3 family transposase [Polaribacter litorisediminis]UAM99102.1 ISL3 family transposase [Polaribacter litorisediminis]